MTLHVADGIEILLWPHTMGLSAFVAPWTFDLEYDDRARATIDAGREPLNVGNYPRSVDRYRTLDGPGRAQILKAALASRDDDRDLRPGDLEGYLVRHGVPGIDEAAFLRIVAGFVHAWRRERAARR